MRFAALVLAFAAVAAAKGAKPKELSQSEFVELGAETLATAKAKHRAFLNTVLKLKGDWWEEYSKDAPPEYLQAPWASAPSMKTVKLPEAPKPMPPPPAPEQGFQGSGKFYPPPPAPPPSPPPPLPPPPPAPATTFAAAQAPSSSTPIVQSHAASPQASGFKDTGASLHPTAKPGEARFTQASASLVANDAASADAVTAPATADKGKTAAPARLRRRLRRGRRTRNDVPDLDAVSSAMFAEADAAGTDASPSESVASAMELLEVASSVGEHAGGRDTSKDGAAAQAGVGGEGERNFQWQYYDPNNPPPWLLPSWNSAPRSHTPPPMLPNLNPASPYPYPGNTQPYSDGYPVGFLEIDALLAKHDRAHPKFEAPERRKPE